MIIYLHTGNSYADEMTFLYWIGPQDLHIESCPWASMGLWWNHLQFIMASSPDKPLVQGRLAVFIAVGFSFMLGQQSILLILSWLTLYQDRFYDRSCLGILTLLCWYFYERTWKYMYISHHSPTVKCHIFLINFLSLLQMIFMNIWAKLLVGIVNNPLLIFLYFQLSANIFQLTKILCNHFGFNYIIHQNCWQDPLKSCDIFKS